MDQELKNQYPLTSAVQVQAQSKIFFKRKVQVLMKSKNFEKCHLFHESCCISFPLTQSKSGRDPKF